MLQSPSPKRAPIYHFDHSVWSLLSSFLNATDIGNLLKTNDTVVVYHLSRSVQSLSLGTHYYESLLYPVSFTIGRNLTKLALPALESSVDLRKCLDLISISNRLTSLSFETLLIAADYILALPLSLTDLSIKNVACTRLPDLSTYLVNHPVILQNGAKLLSIALAFRREYWSLAQAILDTLLPSCVDTLETLDLNGGIDYDLSQHHALKSISFGWRPVDYALKLAPSPHTYSMSLFNLNILKDFIDDGVLINELVFHCDGTITQDEISKMDVSHLTSLTRLAIVGWPLEISTLTCAPINHLAIHTEFPPLDIVNLGPGSVSIHSKSLKDPCLLLSKCHCKSMQDLSMCTSIQIRMDGLTTAKNVAKRGCLPSCSRYAVDPMDADILAPSRFPALEMLDIFIPAELCDTFILKTFVPHHLQSLNLSVSRVSNSRMPEIEWLPPGLQNLELRGFAFSSRLMQVLPFNLMNLYLHSHGDSQGGGHDIESFAQYQLRHSWTQLRITITKMSTPIKKIDILRKVFFHYDVTTVALSFYDSRCELHIRSKGRS